MARITVVTGSASGIGAGTKAALEADGGRVIGVDLDHADICCDLATAAGRAAMIEQVQEISGGVVDAVVANAGIAQADARTVKLNYFGALATLLGLRSLLAAGSTPRATVTTSGNAYLPHDDVIVEACLAGDEDAAIAACTPHIERGAARVIYSSSKFALNQWLVRSALAPDWAGSGISLNAISPGLVRTAATEMLIADPEWLEARRLEMPDVFGNLIGEPREIGEVHAFFTSPRNTRITGQVIHADGGRNRLYRGYEPW
jgi:NAD(P)-dependent dehydrogenase (short-subunit alcohol dehydrogenase family)